MVTTQGAGSGGRLWDSDNKSWAASVSSTLRSLKTEECGGSPPDGPVRSVVGDTPTMSMSRTELCAKYLMLCAEAEGLNLIISRLMLQDATPVLSRDVLFVTAALLMP